MSTWKSKPSANYTSIEAEFEDKLRKAFVTHKADFIYLDNRREVFLNGVSTVWTRTGMVN